MPQILFHEPFVPDALVLDKEGVWRFHGTPFENQKIAKLFSRSIKFDPEKLEYYLQIGRFSSPFKVEDTPFFVEEVEKVDDTLRFNLNNEECAELNEPVLRVAEEGDLYLPLKDTALRRPGERARFTRHAYMELLTLGNLEEHQDSSYVLHIGSLCIRFMK